MMMQGVDDMISSNIIKTQVCESKQNRNSMRFKGNR